jgi:hypothetical protein
MIRCIKTALTLGARRSQSVCSPRRTRSEDQAPLEIADDRQRDPEQICASSEIGGLISEQFNLLSPTLRSAMYAWNPN